MKLANHFEISLRQANRDLEYLRNTLNAPIRYVAAKRGYIYDDMTFILPNLIITGEDKRALSFLAYRYDNYDGTENSQRLANLFRSLSDSEKKNHHAPIFSISDEKVNLYHKLTDYIGKNKKIDVSYLFPNGGPIKLLLHPYRIYGISDIDYLVAYCEEYEDVAVFRLDRLDQCVENAQTYIHQFDMVADQFVCHMKKKPFKAVLRAGPEVDLMNLGDKLTKLEDELYEIDFYDTDQLLRELMLSGQWKEIISPGWLRDKLKNRCQKIYDKLQSSGTV